MSAANGAALETAMSDEFKSKIGLTGITLTGTGTTNAIFFVSPGNVTHCNSVTSRRILTFITKFCLNST
jgi:hypothetical protein